MKRINEFLVTKLILGGLVALLSLVNVSAQNARLNKQKLAKQEQAASDNTAQENAQPQTKQDRPNAPTPGITNPRLQAIVLDRFLPQIDLKQEQRAQIKNLRFQHVRKMQNLLALERSHTKAYDDALFDPNLDQKEIEKRVSQLAEVRTDMLTAQAKFFIELRQVLTPEQFMKLRQIMEDERQKNIQQRLLNQ